MNDGCEASLTSLTGTVTVPDGGCLDVEYSITTTSMEHTYLICVNNGNLGPQNLKCTSKMVYGTESITKEADCNLGGSNNPGNARVSKQILATNPGSVEQSGITFGVSMNTKITCIESSQVFTTCQGIGTSIYWWDNNSSKLKHYQNGCECGGNWGDAGVSGDAICNNGPTKNGGTSTETNGIKYSGCSSGYALTATGTSDVPAGFTCKLKQGWDDNW